MVHVRLFRAIPPPVFHVDRVVHLLFTSHRDTSTEDRVGLFQKLFGERVTRYAVEVEPEFADNFSVPDAEVCEAWESGDGNVAIILKSYKNILSAAQQKPGVRGIRVM